MYKFKMKLLFNDTKPFCTKPELLNFKVTLVLVELDMVGSRLVPNGLIFSDDILVDVQLVILLLLPNIRELSIGVKTKRLWYPSSSVKNTTQLYFRLVSFFSASTCFVLFVSSKSVFPTKSSISALVVLCCVNLTAAKSLNSLAVIYLLLWPWSVIFFSILLIFAS